ncbi:HutD/Ves family protein [Kitasatospora sp. LaBMicrA B282]|uniref:HutD/Ves family protein n=1 Tax=Kitasatospora sp. LaBMicrA B282 TaxID=3420949 RepID=UPI003D0A938C
MTVLQLPAADRTPTPWRNGGGLTREVAAAPDGAWRVSLAEITTDGPFSLFPGLTRVLTVVAGDGLDLTIGDRPPVTVHPRRPLTFPGDLPTTARLLGTPVTALNLMLREDRAHHPDPVQLLPTGTDLHPTPGHPLLAVHLDGYDALLVEHPSRVTSNGPVAVLKL